MRQSNKWDCHNEQIYLPVANTPTRSTADLIFSALSDVLGLAWSQRGVGGGGEGFTQRVAHSHVHATGEICDLRSVPPIWMISIDNAPTPSGTRYNRDTSCGNRRRRNSFCNNDIAKR